MYRALSPMAPQPAQDRVPHTRAAVRGLVDWKSARTAIFVAGVLAAVAAAGGALAGASGDAWAIIVAAVGWVCAAIGIATLESRHSDAVKAIRTATDASLEELRLRVALAEARFALASHREAATEPVWDDAVVVFAGALLEGWTIDFNRSHGILTPRSLVSPTGPKGRVAYRLFFPLTRERVDGTARFLIAHGVPIAEHPGWTSASSPHP